MLKIIVDQNNVMNDKCQISCRDLEFHLNNEVSRLYSNNGRNIVKLC